MHDKRHSRHRAGSLQQRSGFSRRELLAGIAAGTATGALLPGLSLAGGRGDSRLLIVLLRGALDGLAAVPPYGEGGYATLRGPLALPAPGDASGVLKLDGLFGLHPMLSTLHRWYVQGEASVVHAVATPYRARSHFDAQNLLENGTDEPFGAADGWLNRALNELPKRSSRPGTELGIAIGPNVPLILRGAQPVASWAPSAMPEVSDETLDRIADLYAPDPFFSERLALALDTEAMAPEAMGDKQSRSRHFLDLCRAAGSFLAAPDGARVAVLESAGWDTHANQGAHTGALAGRLRDLDKGLAALRRELGAAWDNTVITLITEFGRTAGVNGTRGTDHGTAGALILAGGAVRGGRVLGDWPGIGQKDLYQGRDLMPSTDVRCVLKTVLAAQLGVSESALETHVFPGSRMARPMDGLIDKRRPA